MDMHLAPSRATWPRRPATPPLLGPVRPGSSLPRSNYSDHARECEIHQRAATRHGTEVQATAAAQRIPPRLATVRHGTSQVTERTKGQRGGPVARPTRSPWVVVYMADTCRACTAPTQHARLIFYPYPIPTSSPALSGCRRRRRGLARRPAGLQAPLPLPGRPGRRPGSTGYGVRGEEQRRTRAHRIRSARHEGRSAEPRPAGCSTVRTGTAQGHG